MAVKDFYRINSIFLPEGDVDGMTLKKYIKALHDNDEKLYKQFKKQGIRFSKIYTHEDPALKLMKNMRSVK